MAINIGEKKFNKENRKVMIKKKTTLLIINSSMSLINMVSFMRNSL